MACFCDQRMTHPLQIESIVIIVRIKCLCVREHDVRRVSESEWILLGDQ
jgi:hypothetical protein